MTGTFEELIDSDKPVVVDFFATWCGPCKAMSPALQQLADEMGDKIKVVKIDIDKNKVLQRKFSVNSVPTVMVFKNSKQLFRQSGTMMLPQLKSAVKPHL
ncbi:MAG: thioredoxin 1 [Arcticibacterium sp.]|jgi:thioredoxin 1